MLSIEKKRLLDLPKKTSKSAKPSRTKASWLPEEHRAFEAFASKLGKALDRIPLARLPKEWGHGAMDGVDVGRLILVVSWSF